MLFAWCQKEHGNEEEAMGRIKVIIEILYLILDAVNNQDKEKAMEAVSLLCMYLEEVFDYEAASQACFALNGIKDSIDASHFREALMPLLDMIEDFEQFQGTLGQSLTIH
jgi:hypothetical protein